MKTNNKANEMITVMAQAFYGNRTITEVFADEIDMFLLGWLDSKLYKKYTKPEDIKRIVVKIPKNDNLVLVYNQVEEDENVADHILETACIPEIGLTLHSRCFVCRIDENGNFKSLEDGDIDKFINYLSK